MNNWIGPTVKQQWNFAMHVLHNIFGFNINTTAFCLGRYSLHLNTLAYKVHEYSLICFNTQLRLSVSATLYLNLRRLKSLPNPPNGWSCWAALRRCRAPRSSTRKSVWSIRRFFHTFTTSGCGIVTERRCCSGARRDSTSAVRPTCKSSN